MEYLSTRGSPERKSFKQAVLQGLASDGGLYIPATLPRLPVNWAADWADLPFTALALEIYSLFIPAAELPRQDLAKLIEKSYASFRLPEVAPLVQLADREYVLELFHGPTFAFKDVALQFLGNLFEYFLQRQNGDKAEEDRQRLTVVGATSGDTGRYAFVSMLQNKTILTHIKSGQRCHLRTTEQEGRLHLYPPP